MAKAKAKIATQYRCVKSNKDNTVIAIGVDEKQGGQDYHGIGVWQNFVFTNVPVHNSKIKEWCKNNEFMKPLIDVVNGVVVLKDTVTHGEKDVTLETAANAIR